MRAPRGRARSGGYTSTAGALATSTHPNFTYPWHTAAEHSLSHTRIQRNLAASTSLNRLHLLPQPLSAAKTYITIAVSRENSPYTMLLVESSWADLTYPVPGRLPTSCPAAVRVTHTQKK